MITLFEYFENVEKDDFLTDCKPIIKELKELYKKDFKFLYRGFKGDISPSGSKIETNKLREPKDTDEWLHELADKAFDKYFGWKARSQGVFVIADEFSCEQYGEVYLCFPIGECQFVYSTDIRDLTPQLTGSKGRIDDDVKEEWEAEYGKGGDGSWRYHPNIQVEWKNMIDTKRSKLEDAIAVVKKDPEKYKVEKTLSYDSNVFKNSFYWHPEIDEDEYWNQNAFQRIINDVDDTIKTRYTDKHLFLAMRERYNEYHEIIFKCDEYYLFPLEMKQEIIDLIYDNRI